MGFTTKCFIRKSTKDLTDKLHRIGNRCGRGFWHSEINTLLLCGNTQYRCLEDEWGNSESIISRGYIDCGVNEDLFLAIAALRDDSDVYQYFVNEKGVFVFCNQSELKHVIDNSEDWCDYSVSEFHKATVAELIEHFK